MRFAVAAALALLAGPALAQEDTPEDPCVLAQDLAESIPELEEQIQVMTEFAKPICKYPALAKDCATRRVEIDAVKKDLKAARAALPRAKAACARQTAASPPACRQVVALGAQIIDAQEKFIALIHAFKPLCGSTPAPEQCAQIKPGADVIRAVIAGFIAERVRLKEQCKAQTAKP